MGEQTTVRDRPLRIAYAEISHECCAFNPLTVSVQDFRDDRLVFGDEIPPMAAGVGRMGGFLAAVAEAGHDIEAIPILQAAARPKGR